MPLLAVDIGTNSTLWLVAEVEDGRLTLIERGIAGNRLGAGRSADGSLPPELIAMNRDILAKIVAHAKALGCAQLKGVATQALRTTTNSDDFLQMAAEVGLPVEIIDGEREADLAWRGVFCDKAMPRGAGLLDIGGGSSELAVGVSSGVTWSLSIPVGAVTLTQTFANDPPLPFEFEKAAAVVRESLAPWKDKLPKTNPLTGVAGTVTALASLEMKQIHYTPGALEGETLTIEQVRRWLDRFTLMTLKERESLAGMPPARAAVLPAGVVILHEAMRILGRRTIKVSEKGVMFGLALEMAKSSC